MIEFTEEEQERLDNLAHEFTALMAEILMPKYHSDDFKVAVAVDQNTGGFAFIPIAHGIDFETLLKKFSDMNKVSANAAN